MFFNFSSMYYSITKKLIKNNVVVIFFFAGSFSLHAQDTIYARQVIKKLTSVEMLGRGYVSDGVNKAATYLLSEMKLNGLKKFGKSFSQPYTFNVNTFPAKMNVSVNGKPLIAGKHYLIYPSAIRQNKFYELYKKDSVTYNASENGILAPINLFLKKKLTYTVATSTSSMTTIELLKDSFQYELKNIKVEFENKFIKQFHCQNLCGYIKGIVQPDSFIVFTAHYDHLGAMGKNAYFPGANDNASGVSVLLNLMKYYNAHPSKYSVAFILFSGEEAGLLGSKYNKCYRIF